jgi:hypothetical protein
MNDRRSSMKLKKILFLICVVTIIGVLGITAYAAADNGASSEDGTPYSFRGFRVPWSGKGAESNLTDEQKAEIEEKMADIQSIFDSAITDEQRAEWADRQEQMKSKRSEMEARSSIQNDRWDALTDEQREELYSLQDKTVEAQIAVIDKYLELGVIDAETAQVMKDRLTEGQSNMRENGRMPGFDGGFCRGHRGGFGVGHDMPGDNKDL